MKTFTQKDQALAACIFVLWSFGLIFAPYAQVVFASAATSITLVYLALHVLVFAYTTCLSFQLIRSIQNQKKRVRLSQWAGRAALYAYVLLALAYSTSLLIKLLQ